MNTTYHIGDIFEVPRANAFAIVVKVTTHPHEQYCLSYIDKTTHAEIPSGRKVPHAAWWTAEELKDTFKEFRIM
jgi:hypothetical protein